MTLPFCVKLGVGHYFFGEILVLFVVSYYVEDEFLITDTGVY